MDVQDKWRWQIQILFLQRKDCQTCHIRRWYQKEGKRKKVKGISNVENPPTIEHVLLIDGLNYNLLSISQLCDKCNKVTFESLHEIDNDV
jgi:hypothetical protein